MERGWGRVVFLSSESALNIPTDMIHYGFTKTAALAISRGLAKRVALALDASDLEDTGGIWVAQHDTTVVLKGTVSSQDELDQITEIARGVNGCSEVQTDKVTVG